MNDINKLKISVVYYLNSLPLSWGLLRGEQHHLCKVDLSPPSRCADLLAAGEVDAGLIPAVEYQRIAALRVIPGLAVASKSKVKSVLLLSKVPAQEIRSVALDNSSRTSVCLLKILFKHRFKIEARMVSHPPNLGAMLAAHDAALIIGDSALQAQRSGLFIYDLAEEWKAETGKPFVFAFWAIRRSALRHDLSLFEQSNRFGQEHLEEICREQSQGLGLTHQEVFAYLTENISYTLDRDNLEGLTLFFALAREYKLLDSVRKLEFA